MTVLERIAGRRGRKGPFALKKIRMKPFKTRPSAGRVPRALGYADRGQQLGWNDSAVAISRSLVTSPSPEFQPLELNAYTIEIMQCEVRQLMQRSNVVVTLGDVFYILRSSRDVARMYAATFDQDVWKMQGSIYHRRSKLIEAWHHVFANLSHRFKQPVAHWDQVRQSLEEFFILNDANQEQITLPRQSGVFDAFQQKVHEIHDLSLSSQQEGALSWQRLAAYQSSSHIRNENGQPSSKADQFWLDIIEQAWQTRLERLQTARQKASKERLERKERMAEAERKASRLLRPFTADEQNQVRQALEGGDPGEVLCKFEADSITRHNMETLRPGCWLSDEVIHFFLAMLAQRDKDLCAADHERKPSHFFKSFFMTKLLNEGHATLSGMYEYKNVKRWSKKVPGKDIFGLDKIVFPINVNRSHWVCAVAFMQEKRIQFYDSLGDDGTEFLQAVFRYIQDEHQDKKKSPLPDADKWELIPCTDDTPQQANMVDCGVFTCMFADFVSVDNPLLFGQDHINQCRNRIALSILQGKAIM